ncbi:flavonol sulfotransferase-like [Quercus robur]|uniref:flavonol sulfotransferase-like n=1 Tax=Quercus robur TaxID=38942 RepID=UPI0021621E4C|nr:flavonol sulfotransferase-like [Quercus robur]
MESSSSKMNSAPKSIEKEEYMFDLELENKFKQILPTIPIKKGSWSIDFYQYEGFWYPLLHLPGMLFAQEHFKPQPNQVILSSFPKCGTTWLKALAFAIMTRSYESEPTNPLLSRLSHDCVPFIEFNIRSSQQRLSLDVPLVSTHIPYTSLPKSIINSSCKIVYLCRDPKDVFVSIWHFYNRNVTRVIESELGITREKDVLEEDVLESFCQGLLSCGPFWDHILGYWRASLESPERILFIKYEDLTNETVYWVKKLAQFIGYPFSLEEEDQGMVQKIIDLCSFENMSNLEVNKNGVMTLKVGIKKDEVNTYEFKNNMYFRKGKVGDWKNHLTPAMAKRIDQITEKKLSSYGLTWNV